MIEPSRGVGPLKVIDSVDNGRVRTVVSIQDDATGHIRDVDASDIDTTHVVSRSLSEELIVSLNGEH